MILFKGLIRYEEQVIKSLDADRMRGKQNTIPGPFTNENVLQGRQEPLRMLIYLFGK